MSVSSGAERGHSLAETLIALVVAGTLVAALARLLAVGYAQDADLRSRLAARHAARDAAAVLHGEAEFVSASSGDLPVLTDSSLVVRAMRAAGVVCGVRNGPVLVLRESSFTGARAVDPVRDSALAFLDAAAPWSAPLGWVGARVAAAGAAPCDDGAAGIRLALTAGDSLLNSAPVGTPVRTFELAEYRAYRDAAGEWWLGVRTRSASGWAVISPVAGPLAPGGMVLEALDSAGLPAVAGTTALLAFRLGSAVRLLVDSGAAVAQVGP